jgi:hypothetical protein
MFSWLTACHTCPRIQVGAARGYRPSTGLCCPVQARTAAWRARYSTDRRARRVHVAYRHDFAAGVHKLQACAAAVAESARDDRHRKPRARLQPDPSPQEPLREHSQPAPAPGPLARRRRRCCQTICGSRTSEHRYAIHCNQSTLPPQPTDPGGNESRATRRTKTCRQGETGMGDIRGFAHRSVAPHKVHSRQRSARHAH